MSDLWLSTFLIIDILVHISSSTHTNITFFMTVYHMIRTDLRRRSGSSVLFFRLFADTVCTAAIKPPWRGSSVTEQLCWNKWYLILFRLNRSEGWGFDSQRERERQQVWRRLSSLMGGSKVTGNFLLRDLRRQPGAPSSWWWRWWRCS